MRKFKVATTPAAQRIATYTEGKQAFTEGQRRSYNPYSAHNLELATIWWNGWDAGEEENKVVQPGKKKS